MTIENENIKILVSEWRNSGINEGDVILLHSNLGRLLRTFKKNSNELPVDDVLNSLLATLGENGTLILPQFNFDFANGKPFDIRRTPSHMGILSEVGRLHSQAVRTGHPIYSFVAIGHYSNRFKGLTNISGYGKDSPFAILKELNGKIAVINLPDQNSMTYYHYVEEMMKVDYRYYKNFSGIYTNELGITETKNFQLYVRDLERGVTTDVNNMEELLWKEGLYKGNRHNEKFGCRTINARSLFEVTSEVIRSGRAEGMLYKIQKNFNFKE